ncbi:hypothetical protein [Commensalibacter sp. Nvir]|uniref:hypothetical protein n=1 Tax=Commensalibacter sp. Nvir TaxID=3069817 RepID=UPI0030C8896C
MVVLPLRNGDRTLIAGKARSDDRGDAKYWKRCFSIVSKTIRDSEWCLLEVRKFFGSNIFLADYILSLVHLNNLIRRLAFRLSKKQWLLLRIKKDILNFFKKKSNIYRATFHWN